MYGTYRRVIILKTVIGIQEMYVDLTVIEVPSSNHINTSFLNIFKNKSNEATFFFETVTIFEPSTIFWT